MLKEMHIGAFATWEVELPRLRSDSRFSLIQDLDTKKAVFETFVKNKLEEDRKQNRDKLSKAREECKRLLTEMTYTTTLAEFGKYEKERERERGERERERERGETNKIKHIKLNSKF